MFEKTTLLSVSCYKADVLQVVKEKVMGIATAMVDFSPDQNLMHVDEMLPGGRWQIEKFEASLHLAGNQMFLVKEIIQLCIDIGGFLVLTFSAC